MATATGNYVHDNSTLANFQSWAGAIHSAITGFGWVQTSDTGQTIPSAAVAVPSSTYLYVIYKAADSLAATLPIYLKFWYGVNTTTVQMAFTVGTGSDGAGNITGALATSWQINAYHSNQGATTYPCFFSGDAGSFRMYMWQATISTSCFFSILRSVNSSGVATADYVTVMYADSQNNGNANQQSYTAAQQGNNLSTIVTLALTTSSSGGGYWPGTGTVEAYPVFPIGMGKCNNPMLDVMSCYASDVVDGSTVTVASAYGGTHTYIAVTGANNFVNNIGKRQQAAASQALLMRYE